MEETKFIISEKQILNGVRYVLEQNIKKKEIVEVVMRDVEDEIEMILYDDCDVYKEKIKE